jgi:hypothetical protein
MVQRDTTAAATLTAAYATGQTGCSSQQRTGRDIYAFNNDVGGHAPRNAVTLRRMMEEDE